VYHPSLQTTFVVMLEDTQDHSLNKVEMRVSTTKTNLWQRNPHLGTSQDMLLHMLDINIVDIKLQKYVSSRRGHNNKKYDTQ
jgi:hypothetical protein